jgi:hypothetical protein
MKRFIWYKWWRAKHSCISIVARLLSKKYCYHLSWNKLGIVFSGILYISANSVRQKLDETFKKNHQAVNYMNIGVVSAKYSKIHSISQLVWAKVIFCSCRPWIHRFEARSFNAQEVAFRKLPPIYYPLSRNRGYIVYEASKKRYYCCLKNIFTGIWIFPMFSTQYSPDFLVKRDTIVCETLPHGGLRISLRAVWFLLKYDEIPSWRMTCEYFHKRQYFLCIRKSLN